MASNTKDHSTKLAADHTPDAIRQRLNAPTKHSYLRDFIYGAIDGAVTTFAVVCGARARTDLRRSPGPAQEELSHL